MCLALIARGKAAKSRAGSRSPGWIGRRWTPCWRALRHSQATHFEPNAPRVRTRTRNRAWLRAPSTWACQHRAADHVLDLVPDRDALADQARAERAGQLQAVAVGVGDEDFRRPRHGSNPPAPDPGRREDDAQSRIDSTTIDPSPISAPGHLADPVRIEPEISSSPRSAGEREATVVGIGEGARILRL